MDDAERIPIDIGYEVAAAGLEQTDQRTTVREDGTVVIDILSLRPCAPEPSTDEEIVVCAQAPDDGPLRPLPRPVTPTPMDILAEAFSATVGPVEIMPGGPAGTAGIGLRIRF